MRIVEPTPAARPPATSRPLALLTRPLPGWVAIPKLLGGLAGLVALLVTVYVVLARPVLTRTWEADRLTETVADKNDYRLFPAETGPGGIRFAWAGPDAALLLVPATAQNDRPVTVIVRARGASAAGGPPASTKVKANGVPIGEINPQPGQIEFQDFRFTFRPASRDDNRIRLTFDTPPWKPSGDKRVLGFAIKSLTVDLAQVWSTLFGSGRDWLILVLPALSLLTLLAGVGQKRQPSNLLASYGTVGLAFANVGATAALFFLLSRVGYNGELDRDFFWLYALGLLYLSGFWAWLGLTGPRWGTPVPTSMWQRISGRTLSWRTAHPVATAFVTIFLVNLALSFLFVGKIWLETGGIEAVFRYLDGPEYVVIANNFYDLQEPLLKIPDFAKQSDFYWAAHFPGYPVALMGLRLAVGWLLAPLAVNFLASTGFALVFYRLLRDFDLSRHPLWLSLVALVLPVRWLIYHNVGGSEPLFMFFELLAVYWFKKERYWLAGLAGFGAVFTRPPGLFLWVGFGLFLLFEAGIKAWNAHNFSLAGLVRAFRWRAFAGLLLMPLGLVAVFGVYAWRYGDFWAYFKITENVTHVGLIPFPTLMTGLFDSPALIFTYLLGLLGLIKLWRQGRYDLFWVGFASYFYTVFLLHSDVLRYSIPFFALIVLIPFAEYVGSKGARWVAGPVLVALVLYSWGAFSRNLIDRETFEAMRTLLKGL